MNTKLSGAQMVLVPITQLGHNRMPFLENIKGRYIKFIDFYGGSQYLPNVTDTAVQTTENMFITIYDEWGNTEIIRNLPLERFNYTQTLGIRQQIGSKISLRDCYIDCQNPSCIGKTVAIVFYYDLPEYSAKNCTDNLVTDNISIPLTTITRYNKLPDDERMVNKRFRRILLAAPSTTPDLQSGVSYANLHNLYITLRKGSFVIFDNLPIMFLYQLTMLEKSELQNILFDFQSSYITVGGAGTITPSTDYVGKSVFLNLQYEQK